VTRLELISEHAPLRGDVVKVPRCLLVLCGHCGKCSLIALGRPLAAFLRPHVHARSVPSAE